MLLALLALLLTGCGNAEPKNAEAEIGSQSTDDAAALPDTTEQKPVADAPMMVMVDNTLYQSTGEVSTVDGRCGNMAGEITSQTANGTDAPTENGQSNFGTGYGYQRIDDHIEVLIDNQWIVFLCVTATVVAVLAAVFWDVMPLGSKAGVFVAFIMAFHVLEEWKFPGGLHWFYNTSVFRPKDESLYDPTRYPMSRLTDMVTNVGLQWIPLIYAALCFFVPLSNAVALCVILLCVMELFAHTAGGVATYLWYRDKGEKTIYHTGLATSLMMFLPAAAYLIAHIAGVTATDWLWCLVLFAVMCCVCVPLTETPLKKWVRKQEPGMFAFEDAKYYMRYGGYCKEDVEQSEARVD